MQQILDSNYAQLVAAVAGRVGGTERAARRAIDGGPFLDGEAVIGVVRREDYL